MLEAAADTFAEKGISATTIEDICGRAGFSRGAFYSNFSAKDELVLELLEDHLSVTLAEVDRLFDLSEDTESFIMLMESDERRRTDPTGANGLLYIELLLFAMRNPDNRPRLVERQRRARDKTVQTLRKIEADAGRRYPGRIEDMAALILAYDDGLLLHQLIDPDSYREGQYSETMVALHQLWTSQPPDQD